MKRDLINMQDLSADEIAGLLKLAIRLKKREINAGEKLKGKTLALIFQKPSNRTRISFEVGIYQLGGNCLYLAPEEINLGKRESTADVAKTISRYLDGVVARTFSHDDIVELGRCATIPIINGLSDLDHPCQALADLMTIQERFQTLKGRTLAYVGDGNNVCHSLMIASALTGMNIHVATPEGYEPKSEVIDIARKFAAKSGAAVKVMRDPKEAVTKAHIIYTDTWTSMGQEDEAEMRERIFSDYQVNAALASRADKNYGFMHCLPAHRGQEVTAEIIDGPNSFVFDQAENRLHVQKAILIYLLCGTYQI